MLENPKNQDVLEMQSSYAKVFIHVPNGQPWMWNACSPGETRSIVQTRITKHTFTVCPQKHSCAYLYTWKVTNISVTNEKRELKREVQTLLSHLRTAGQSLPGVSVNVALPFSENYRNCTSWCGKSLIGGGFRSYLTIRQALLMEYTGTLRLLQCIQRLHRPGW